MCQRPASELVDNRGHAVHNLVEFPRGRSYVGRCPERVFLNI